MPERKSSRHSPASAGPATARRVAFDILLRVEAQASFATDLLNSPMTARLSERDAALATELVMGTLRWQGALDFIAQRSAHRWDSLDPEVRVALRMGLYQLRVLCRAAGRMPPRAALYETVEVVKATCKRGAAGFVNAVLRKSMEDVKESGDRRQESGETGEPFRDLGPLRPAAMPETDWLAVEYSHPAWLLQRWIARFGRESALAIAAADNRPPTTFFSVDPSSRPEAEVESELAAQRVEVAPGKFLKQSRMVVRGNITRTEIYRRGEVLVQDEASQIVPYLLDVREGQRVLDLCAAPGNKTRQLARSAGAAGEIVACDLHLHRLRKMPGTQDSIAASRSGGAKVHRVVLDAERPLPFATGFDRILIDAPCSGTGTLARHPEIKWRLKPPDIPTLAGKQLRLLHNASEALAPGGRMVYSVCSLEAEEGSTVAEKFLASHPEYRLYPLRDDAPRLRPFFHQDAAIISQNDYFITDPVRDGVDGFFAAVFVREGS